jgi:SecD/SecF fusion protein
MVGVASGAYSSIFIATPVLTHWKQREPAYRARRQRLIDEMGYLPTFPEENVVAKVGEEAGEPAPAARVPARVGAEAEGEVAETAAVEEPGTERRPAEVDGGDGAASALPSEPKPPRAAPKPRDDGAKAERQQQRQERRRRQQRRRRKHGRHR